MSMHKKPLTPTEEAGLKAHGLRVGSPSQLSDCFRQGVAWGIAAEKAMSAQLRESLVDTLDFLERHSNRWDGVNGKHPYTVVEAARLALKDEGPQPESVGRYVDVESLHAYIPVDNSAFKRLYTQIKAHEPHNLQAFMSACEQLGVKIPVMWVQDEADSQG